MNENLLDFISTQKPPSPAGNRIFLYPNIPDRHLLQMTRYFKTINESEHPLILVDSSKGIFAKKGSSGILATTDAIYSFSTWSDSYFIDTCISMEHMSIHELTTFRENQGQYFNIMLNGVPLFGTDSIPKELSNSSTANFIFDLLSGIITRVQGEKKFSAKEIIMSYRYVLQNRNIFFPDRLPDEMLMNARNSYASFKPSNEQPLFLYNDGKNGERGLVLTDKRVFACGSSDFYRVWDIASINNVWLGFYQGKIRPIINNTRLYGWGSTFFPDNLILANMIVCLVNKLKKGANNLPIISGAMKYPDDLNFNVTEPRYTRSLK